MIEQIFASENPRTPLFRLAFRSLFLFGALFSSISLGIWISTLNGLISPTLYGGSLFWHMHEMLFGFVAAIVVGFLLTAVQTWTGVKSVNGWPLFILFSLWFCARIAFLFGEFIQNDVLIYLDLSFLILAAVFLSIPIFKVKQWRNLFFVPVLLLLSICNGLMHTGLLKSDHGLIKHGMQSSILLVAVLMTVIGGRVIPMFTANGTKTKRVANVPWLDKLALASVWMLMLVHLSSAHILLPASLVGWLFFVAGGANIIRLLRWRFWITFKEPLLWPLHLAYGFIGFSFLMLGVSQFSPALIPSMGWHTLTVGGMGILILSMIARVSLGHTGRALKAPGWMIPAFYLIAVSALLRTLFPVLFAEYALWWISLSGILWLVAYATFFAGYFSILTRPRIDQKPG